MATKPESGGEFLCEEEHLLEKMLNDYYEYSCLHPSDEGEYQNDMVMMRETYLENPSKSSVSRLDAYREGRADDFMEQPAEMIICQACGAHYYYIGSLEATPVCYLCHKDETILEDISVWAIPAYVDADTFYWKVPNMPDVWGGSPHDTHTESDQG